MKKILTILLLAVCFLPMNVQANEKEIKKITIGCISTIDSFPLYIAKERGLFAEKYLDVDLKVFQTGLETTSLFQAGQLHAIACDVITILRLEKVGRTFETLVTTTGPSFDTRNFALVSSPKSSIQSLEDLKNQKQITVGLSLKTCVEYMTDQIIDWKSYPNIELKKILIPQMPLRLSSLIANQIQLAALPEPYITLAESKGCKVLIDDKCKNLWQTLIAFQKCELEPNKKLIKKLRKVLQKSMELINKERHTTHMIAEFEKFAKIPTALKGKYAILEFPKEQMLNKEVLEKARMWIGQNS